LNNQIIWFTIGTLLVIVGVAGLIPAAVDWHSEHDNHVAFFKCAIISLFFGGALILGNRNFERTLSGRQTFLLTTLSWLFLGIFSSFPLYFSDLQISFTDAFFESISGITTTGSTVLNNLDDMSHGLLLWRSITQWIGGIGIIAFAILILPFLRIGGMQLFQTESSDRSDKIMPRTENLIKSLLLVYVALTLICIVIFYLLGMTVFDAINHALTTIPTGGFSTHDASFGYFQSGPLDYAASFFMLAGGIPFVLYVKYLFQGEIHFLKDEQVRSLMIMLVIFITFLTAWLCLKKDFDFFSSLQLVVFNVISVITTTGFATTDYTDWGSFAAVLFFFLTSLGACAGSTSGGIKVMRVVVAVKVMFQQMKALIFPHGLFPIRYQGNSISASVSITVMSFLSLYIFSIFVLTVALALVGLDFETAVSGAATALANVGPGLGDTIGPAGNFSSLPDAAKWLLSGGMLFGRLEIMTVLVLFRYEYWQP
jgi:trk system potassium uptake protein TrkH